MEFNGGVGRLYRSRQGRWGSGPLAEGLIEFVIFVFYTETFIRNWKIE
jgi:hypothetical protein